MCKNFWGHKVSWILWYTPYPWKLIHTKINIATSINESPSSCALSEFFFNMQVSDLYMTLSVMALLRFLHPLDKAPADSPINDSNQTSAHIQQNGSIPFSVSFMKYEVWPWKLTLMKIKTQYSCLLQHKNLSHKIKYTCGIFFSKLNLNSNKELYKVKFLLWELDPCLLSNVLLHIYLKCLVLLIKYT